VTPITASAECTLARLEGRYVEAEQTLERASAIQTKIPMDKENEKVNRAMTLFYLANLRELQGRCPEAERLFRRILEIDLFLPKNIAPMESALGSLLAQEARYAEAERLLRSAVAKFEDKSDGTVNAQDNPWLAVALRQLARVLIHEHNDHEGEVLLTKALTIDEKVMGSEGSFTIIMPLDDLAQLYKKTGPIRRSAWVDPSRNPNSDHPNISICWGPK
jgi:tetratricopeptide (TPR) repeat protein